MIPKAKIKMYEGWVHALIGGSLIGVAASVLLLFNGEVAGVSGILKSAITKNAFERLNKFIFLAGLLCGGFFLRWFNPDIFSNQLTSSNLTVVIAGVLVGFGTALSGGCTSGHGVCGISRLSARSIIATMVFICAGIISVFVFKKLGFIL